MENRIAEIKRRISETTPGKWTVEYDEDVYITSKGLYVAQLTCEGLSATRKHNVKADAEFISRAKEDIEYLISLLDV